jgi:hypothetical protein
VWIPDFARSLLSDDPSGVTRLLLSPSTVSAFASVLLLSVTANVVLTVTIDTISIAITVAATAITIVVI